MPGSSGRRRSLARRAMGRARRELAGLGPTTVRLVDQGTVRVSRWPGALRRTLRWDDPAAGHRVRAHTLRLLMPDASALARLAASGLLAGEIRRLRVRLASAPEWSVTGVRPPRLGRTVARFGWRRRGRGLTVGLRWSRPYEVHRALGDAAGAVMRARRWDQASGPVYALDRSGWLDGGPLWPQGQLTAAPPGVARDEQGRPLGPYLPLERPAAPPGATAASRATVASWATAAPILTAVANPYGRRLVGAATPYRLEPGAGRILLRDLAGRVVLRIDRAGGAEAAVAGAGIAKYAVATVDAAVPAASTTGPSAGGFMVAVLRSLAACGVVFAAPDPAVRTDLNALGVVTVADAAQVDDLAGYALSVEASRRTALTGDAALRRTALGGDGALPLPTVTAVLASKRPEHLETCLGYLAGQTYPAMEAVVGLHGYDVTDGERQRWRAALPFPVRLVPLPGSHPFGAVLGRLSRLADGEFVTKLDDDDHYGPHHVTDLFLAWHTSGADLVAKGARFVHLPERDQTIDRAWAAPEGFDVTPAGGTILISRGALQQVGGWSHSSRHVDEDLLTRVRSAGGLVYRTHALEYVYVRRTAGHTFATEAERLTAQAERVYRGLPGELIRPGLPAGADSQRETSSEPPGPPVQP